MGAGRWRQRAVQAGQEAPRETIAHGRSAAERSGFRTQTRLGCEPWQPIYGLGRRAISSSFLFLIKAFRQSV